MTQDFSSSEEPSSTSETSEVERFTLVAAVGIMGTKDDCERFMELMVNDFGIRCVKANEKIFKGRITILPPEEVIPNEVQ